MKLISVATILSAFFVKTFGHENSPQENQDLYVVTYSRSMTLSDLVDVLEGTDAQLEKQLSCTRGLLVRFGSEQDKNKISALDGIKIHAYSSTHASGLSINESTMDTTSSLRKLNNQCTCEAYADDNNHERLTFKEARGIWQYIIDEIQLNQTSFSGSITDSAGELLRLAFHDVAPFNGEPTKPLSGANGCVDTSLPANFGLENSIEFLKTVQEGFLEQRGKTISMADLIAIGGSAAVRATGGPVIRIPLGRWDVPCGCEADVFPSAEAPGDAENTLVELAGRLGLNRRDMVALMGAHTLGRLNPDNTGYDGTWVLEADAEVFSNMYFKAKFCIPWLKISKTFNNEPLTEWIIDPQFGDVTFLNTDTILAFTNLEECNVFGGVSNLPPNFDASVCNLLNGGPFPEGGPLPPGFTPFPCPFRNPEGAVFRATVEFAQNKQAFFKAFKKAYQKMVRKTVPCGQLYNPTN